MATSTEGVLVQVNFKTRNGMLINAYGRNADELDAALAVIQERIALMGEIESHLNGVDALASVMQVTAVAEQPQYQAAPAAPAAPAPAAGGWAQPTPPPAAAAGTKSCVHGPAKLVPAGISKKTGNPYNAFYACGAGVQGCKPA